jgi:hypothetical protein
VLSSSLAEFSKLFVVVDAIDEYPDDQRCILLEHLAEVMGPRVSLMVTSRSHILADPALPNVEALEIGAMPEDCKHGPVFTHGLITYIIFSFSFTTTISDSSSQSYKVRTQKKVETHTWGDSEEGH